MFSAKKKSKCKIQEKKEEITLSIKKIRRFKKKRKHANDQEKSKKQ